MVADVLAACLVASALVLPVQSPSPALHLVIERQFNFLSAVRSTTTEMWMAPGRTVTKAGNRVTIKRDDLGVRWRIDVRAGTYVEEKIVPPAAALAPPREDIHTVGFDYEPEYEWTFDARSDKTSIAGRPCQQVIAKGDADYAEATVKFWVCEPMPGINYAVNEPIASALFSDSARKMVSDTVQKRKAWVLGVEENQEPAISPTMVVTVNVKTLEATQAPAGTFDLPANLRKAGR